MHSGWNEWPQRSVFTVSPSSNSERQIEHIGRFSGSTFFLAIKKGKENQRRLEVVRLDLFDVVGAAVLLDEVRRARNENQEIVAAAQQSHHLRGNHYLVRTEMNVRTICQNDIGASTSKRKLKSTLIVTTDRNRERCVLLDKLQQLDSNRIGDSNNWNGDLRWGRPTGLYIELVGLRILYRHQIVIKRVTRGVHHHHASRSAGFNLHKRTER